MEEYIKSDIEALDDYYRQFREEKELTYIQDQTSQHVWCTNTINQHMS